MRGPISIAVTGAISLATETVSAIKHRNTVTIEELNDDDDWVLDETQAQLDTGGNVPVSSDDRDVDEIVQYFVQRYPQADPPHSTSQQLLNPVIIPQRRPRAKARGFIRAYAPVLQDRGIDQTMFMDFLQGIDDSIKA